MGNSDSRQKRTDEEIQLILPVFDVNGSPGLLKKICSIQASP